MSATATSKLIAAVLVAAAIAPGGASARLTTLGLGGWQVQSSALVRQGAGAISQPGFPTGSWLQVRPDDAGAVGTEVGALVQNGRCPSVFFSTNMKTCFGYMNQVGSDTIPMFSVPWWFRTTFTATLQPGQHAQLIINGVVGEADVWVNGTRVASNATVQGAYTRYTFDVTRLVARGDNALALEVRPNDPNTMFTLDNVDWTQIPPDNNTGIQFPIQLHTAGPLELSNAHVVQHNNQSLNQSALTLRADVTNASNARAAGELSAVVTSPSGEAIRVHRWVSVAPGTTRTISLQPSQDPALVIHDPSVWWPYQMGARPLYGLTMAVSQPGSAPDSQSETFGIRTITTRLVGASAIAPQGSRQFLVNGRPFVFRGGGWSEDLFLRYSAPDTATQIALIKNLGLNGIRTEGKQMPDDFYEQMDRAGILIDGGFQCCDAWQLPDGGNGVTSHDYELLYLSALAIGENMRNHPSVLNFSWSDNNPVRQQEAVSLKGFRQADFQEPLIASAEYKSTPTLGPSGEKEGPYDWVPPSYWYDTTHYSPGDSTRTNVGGAWAFDSETSSGDTVPTLDSINRFMSPFEQTQLWQQPNYNQYHANYEPRLPGPENGGYSFGTLRDLDQAIANRYGKWSSLADYVEKAQVQNYETQRAEFEAYIDHSKNANAPSTGIVYWQLNKGSPTVLWDLYNNDFDQAGSYFGAKKANESLHALYTYDTGAVAIDNLTGERQAGLSVEANVYDIAGNLLDRRRATGISLEDQGVVNGVLHPSVPAATAPPTKATAYFVELVLSQRGQGVDRNVYWLSTQQDQVGWDKTIGNPQATMARYAGLTRLQSLPAAHISVTAQTHAQTGGPDGSDTVTDVTITNTGTEPTPAFFLRADVRRGSGAGTPAAGDNEVLPIFWSDNDITLWPGESQTLSASYRSSDLRGQSPVVSVGGWNVSPADVAAP